MNINLKRYILYLVRWQLSTPILAWCVILFVSLGPTWATVIANFVGGLIFFWIDRFIFQSEKLDTVWDVKEKIRCINCGEITRGYRLIRSKNYDKSHDKHPEYRCEKCSIKKIKKLKTQGIYIENK